MPVAPHRPAGAMAMAPHLLIRVGGLPFAAMEDLACLGTAQQAAVIVETERWLAEAASVLCDTLFAAIGRCGENRVELRKQLIQAKRDLHNGRLPAAVAEVLAELAPAERFLFATWMERAEAVRKAFPLGERLLGEEMDQVRARLQRWAVEPEFASSMVLASLALHEKLQEYVATPAHQQHSRLRKLEPALAMYLARAATKTSPFAGFTPMATGVWVENGRECATWVEAVDSSRSPAALVALNQATLSRLAAAAARCPALRRYASVRLNPTLQVEAGRYVAYGCFEQFAHTRVAFTGERHVAVERSPEADHLVAVIGKGAATWGEALRQAPAGWSPDQLEALLEVLVEAHVTELFWPVPESALDYPAALAEAMAAIPGARARKFRGHLRNLSGQAARYTQTPLAERPRLLSEISATLHEAYGLVGVDPGELPVPQLFVDEAWTGQQLHVGAGQWEAALDGLRRIERLLPIFDRWRVGALIIRDLFVKEYGPGGVCADIIGFFMAVQDLIPFLNTMTVSELTPIPREVTEANRLLETFGQGLRAAADEAGDRAEVALDPAWLDRLASQVPSVLHSFPTAHGYLVQPVPTRGQCVVNEITPGFAHMPARYAMLIDERAAEPFSPRLRSYLETLLDDGRQFLELPGVFGFNANRRPPLLNQALAYPGVVSPLPPAAQVPLHDLLLRHCPQQGRLVLEHRVTGEEMVPVNLGGLSLLLCPILHRALLMLSPVGSVGLSVLDLLEQERSAEEREQPRRYPRIRIDGAVISRQTWLIPRQHLPMRTKGTSDFAYFVEVERWRRALGLPNQIFLRTTRNPAPPFPVSPATGAATHLAEVRDQQRKPQFIDFRSPLLLRVFEKHLDAVAEALVVEEMFPAPQDLMPGPQGTPVVSEWLIELSSVGTRVKERRTR